MKWTVFIIVLVAVLTMVFLPTGLAGDCIGVAGFIWYALLPFLDRKRVRAHWAIFSIMFSGLLGVAMATLNLLRYSGMLEVSSHENHTIAYYSSFSHGLILGIIFLLLISGQMLGIRRDGQQS
jgi:hypothetical protein